eukprot:TRINITY_DN8387_c0_g1_i1.p1 TRINITY_DN8387_c0_g1~~TRINITY_DN8387_c0_g1_i1.p1  ORF type:complete len:509 (+),score=122.12 TRINITY_DN8387_c0_g1_i1:45-1571(+)
MISAVSWVPCGVAKRVPVRYEPTEEEIKTAQEQLLGRADKPSAHEASAEENKEEPDSETKAIIDEFALENYDEEEEGIHIHGAGMNVEGVSYHEGKDGDPYVTFEGSDSDEENFFIEPTDALVLAAYTDEDVSMLQVHVYETLEDNLYIHHDLLLSAFPLSIARFDANPNNISERGNYVAIGTFNPVIELWDLDLVDSFEPVATLGGVVDGASTSKGKKKSKKKSKPQYLPGSHEDAVMALSWNAMQRNVLASGSADTTVKLWDITTQNCLLTMNHHQNKVQSLHWHPVEQSILLSGGFDKQVCVVDCRSPNTVGRWNMTSDVESLTWNLHMPEQFLVSCEDGTVTSFDARKPGAQAIFTLSAHNLAVSSISMNPTVPGMLATCSIDKHLKIWDIADNKPSCIFSRELDLGSIFSVSFCPNNPFCLAMGGEKRGARVWDSSENPEVWRRFSPRVDTTKVTQKQTDMLDSLQKMSMLDDNSDESDHEDVAGYAPKAPTTDKKKKAKKPK